MATDVKLKKGPFKKIQFEYVHSPLNSAVNKKHLYRGPLPVQPSIVSIIKKTRTWQGHAESDSMEPFIAAGDVVVFHRLDSKIKLFTIIAYPKKDGKIRVHRVMSIDEKNQLITTKGDNLPLPDKPIRIATILGAVITIKKEGTDYVIVPNSTSMVVLFFLYRTPLLKKFIARIFKSHRFLSMISAPLRST